jgi:hypothetical protein
MLRFSTTADHADWITFAPAGGGFTCQFPETPDETNQTVSTLVGPTPATLWIYSPSADLGYAVMLVRYPSGSMARASSSAVYRGALNGITNKVGGTTTMGTTALSSHPAETFTVWGASVNVPGASLHMNVKGVMVLVGDDLYAAYGVYTAAADMAEIDKFIATFDLTI